MINQWAPIAAVVLASVSFAVAAATFLIAARASRLSRRTFETETRSMREHLLVTAEAINVRAEKFSDNLQESHFEVYEEDDGTFSFRLISVGRILIQGERFASLTDARAGVKDIQITLGAAPVKERLI